MSVPGIQFVSAAAPSTGAAPPPVSAHPSLAGAELARAVAAAGGAGTAADAGTGSEAGGGANGRAGTPISAPATRADFDSGSAPRDPAPEVEIEIPLLRAWRMADVVAALAGGPRAERLLELASRPGPVQPGSLLEAIKQLHPGPDAGASRAV